MPPIWIRARMINFPRKVYRVAVSTTASPVTHTALVDVNKASVKLIGMVVDIGIISSMAPAKIKNAKLVMNSCAGLSTLISKLIEVIFKGIAVTDHEGGKEKQHQEDSNNQLGEKHFAGSSVFSEKYRTDNV